MSKSCFLEGYYDICPIPLLFKGHTYRDVLIEIFSGALCLGFMSPAGWQDFGPRWRGAGQGTFGKRIVLPPL